MRGAEDCWRQFERWMILAGESSAMYYDGTVSIQYIDTEFSIERDGTINEEEYTI